jgi:hypothetical protein
MFLFSLSILFLLFINVLRTRLGRFPQYSVPLQRLQGHTIFALCLSVVPSPSLAFLILRVWRRFSKLSAVLAAVLFPVAGSVYADLGWYEEYAWAFVLLVIWVSGSSQRFGPVSRDAAIFLLTGSPFPWALPVIHLIPVWLLSLLLGRRDSFNLHPFSLFVRLIFPFSFPLFSPSSAVASADTAKQ